jgi:hypothetical protein
MLKVLDSPELVQNVLRPVHQVLEVLQLMHRLKFHEILDYSIKIIELLAEYPRGFFIRLRRGLFRLLSPEVNLVLNRSDSGLGNTQRDAQIGLQILD